MGTWVSILAGRSASEARPVFTSSDPLVLRAALEAVHSRVGHVPHALERLRLLTDPPTPDETAGNGVER